MPNRKTAKEAKKEDDWIEIRGARVHNLQNVHLKIPRDRLTVITGLSGSGKSSLAFDTLFAEGQRRYVESLSSYARQFLGRMEKPDVDQIIGLSPAIAIEQKVNTRNPRSTVGTSTEIYDYLKLLYARVGKTYSPISGNEVKRHTVEDVLDAVHKYTEDTKALLIATNPIPPGRSAEEHIGVLLQQGFSRFFLGDEILELVDAAPRLDALDQEGCIRLVIDRFVIKHNDDEHRSRLADSVETAFFEGEGACSIICYTDKGAERLDFSNRFEQDGMTFDEPTIHLFSFNNPYGACRTCEGFGSIIGIDEKLVIPDQSVSVYDDAVLCWRGEKMGKWKEKVVMNAYKSDFPIHKPYAELNETERDQLWHGTKDFKGIYAFFKYLEEKSYKIQYRVMLSRYRGRTVCPDCRGSRIRKEAGYVKIKDTSIRELVHMPVSKLSLFFDSLSLSKHDEEISKRVLSEIRSRLSYLEKVGLGYLNLNRLSSSLSGGESQRINLSTSLGSSLVGSMYILDEPSIGLHPRDTTRLIQVLHALRDLGNTVIVVEHDEEIMDAADRIVDMGPGAGYLGGKVVFEGTHEDLVHNGDSYTTGYLTGKLKIPRPTGERNATGKIMLTGARENNLKNISVQIPLGQLTVVTGVSGSGKSSLIKGILYPALQKALGGYAPEIGRFDELKGDTNRISSVEFVDQNP
ncbi:MAG: excinuclease ABC subunit A, partial [Flavobacteriales bacterium]|nr:excinuclease ABC subunit A [Flavobacteriales bacterium]